MLSSQVVRDVHDTNGATRRPLLALAVILAATLAIAVALTRTHDLSWLAAVGTFYGLFALCQIAYLGLVVVQEWDGAPDRSS
ncbi:hypothetical protein [Methylobacterium sp. E-045]|uniref:hypothetical protein n=1 Tax=Methylobacterium sp. E-045 TaxID=2836575 RepID=UPI001FBBE677|nr:hypothetical protein [Methylobacterium sp. E-045]MCJ2132427.1 hypothetical protein [Methylobacterium sp. E-045]